MNDRERTKKKRTAWNYQWLVEIALNSFQFYDEQQFFASILIHNIDSYFMLFSDS